MSFLWGGSFKRYLCVSSNLFGIFDFLINMVMRIVEYIPEHVEQLDEISWKGVKNTGKAAIAAGLLGNAVQDYADRRGEIDAAPQQPALASSQVQQDVTPAPKPNVQKPSVDNVKKTGYTPITTTNNEKVLAKVAQEHGIRGVELASFMSQMAHESQNFTNMIEDSPNIQRYLANKQLGNLSKNDAERFIGRGFIQLTGRWNYEWMQKTLGIDLTSTWSNAQRAADPAIAAEIAVVYWKKRVQPRVDDYTDTKSVTKPINTGLSGLNDRDDKFKTIARHMNLDV